ncbi:MAG: hypothetical protein Q8R53_02350 [Nanoarchaeota archaeon]|nr:hypothetical protein [Nanoarchaeota archaeon]
MEKKAQVEITFHWIYVLIAGAVILLFFVGIVVKQKAASEESLAMDVVQIMESIFTGASVSEQTKNFIDTSSLVDYPLYFSCADGITEYGISGLASVQNTVDTIFAPSELQAPQLILWSLPFQFPFKVMDFLFVTASNIKYVIVGESGGFQDEFLDAAYDAEERLRIDVEEVSPLMIDIIKPGQAFHIRFIFLDRLSPQLPESVWTLDDNKVSAVVFSADGRTAEYYEKKGTSFQKMAGKSPVSILSLGGERDAAKYAAIFAGTVEMYDCTMQKAWWRLSYLIDIYREKLSSIQEYYDDLYASEAPFPERDCRRFYQEGGVENNFAMLLDNFQRQSSSCRELSLNCASLQQTAAALEITNNRAAGECLSLY